MHKRGNTCTQAQTETDTAIISIAPLILTTFKRFISRQFLCSCHFIEHKTWKSTDAVIIVSEIELKRRNLSLKKLTKNGYLKRKQSLERLKKDDHRKRDRKHHRKQRHENKFTRKDHRKSLQEKSERKGLRTKGYRKISATDGMVWNDPAKEVVKLIGWSARGLQVVASNGVDVWGSC